MGVKKNTLCWRCSKACGKCSWSGGKFIPVEGWVAVPTCVQNQHGKLRSYAVQYCPEFEEDLLVKNKPKVEIKRKRKRRAKL